MPTVKSRLKGAVYGEKALQGFNGCARGMSCLGPVRAGSRTLASSPRLRYHPEIPHRALNGTLSHQVQRSRAGRASHQAARAPRTGLPGFAPVRDHSPTSRTAGSAAAGPAPSSHPPRRHVACRLRPYIHCRWAGGGIAPQKGRAAGWHSPSTIAGGSWRPGQHVSGVLNLMGSLFSSITSEALYMSQRDQDYT